MPGCCLVAAVAFFGPRVLLFFAWLMSDWYAAFDSPPVALAGWVLMPWTSLAWIWIHFHNAGQLDGGYVVLLLLGVLGDFGAIGGGARSRRRRASNDD